MNRTALVFICFIFLLIIYELINHFSYNIYKEREWINRLDSSEIIDTKFFITPDTGLVFSSYSKTQEHFIFQKFKNKHITQLEYFDNDIFSPFTFKNNIYGITDRNGDEKYRPTYEEIPGLLKNAYLEMIGSSINGKFILFKFKHSKDIFLYNAKEDKTECIENNVNEIHSFIFSEDETSLVVSYDCNLVIYHLGRKERNVLAKNIIGEKLNPCIYKKWVYFVSDYNSEYFNIYRINTEFEEGKCKLIYTSDHDLRLPKCSEEYLYFVEVLNNEYLLKRIKLNTRDERIITNKGVVYNYDFLPDGNIIILYSDYNHPTSLILYRVNENSLIQIFGTKIIVSSKYNFQKRTDKLSAAYKYIPDSKLKVKGIILFFHPGLKSDFSPRWEPILNTLAEIGYIVICPNYPMSFGYGKKFRNAGFIQAVEDMIKWKKEIISTYKGLPLFYLSSSSGNLLMETCLLKDQSYVSAYISMFGLSNNTYLPSIPACYVFGEQDPIVDYKKQKKYLNKYQRKDIEIVSYKDEGHWFRKQNNIKDCVKIIMKFINKH